MDREEAIEIARTFARRFPESYTAVEDFTPHEWVIQAIQDTSRNAHTEGFDEGYDEGYDVGVNE